MSNHSEVSKNEVTGLILCGGRSIRFGSPKARHRFEGATLLELTIQKLDPMVAEVWLGVGNSQGGEWPKLRLLTDTFPEVGPIGGLDAALSVLQTNWLFVLPVDMPFMDQHSLSRLLNSVRGTDTAVIARDPGGRVHPLCGLYHRSAKTVVDDAINAKEFGIRHLLSGINSVRYVTLPQDHLRNVNRPEDFL